MSQEATTLTASADADGPRVESNTEELQDAGPDVVGSSDAATQTPDKNVELLELMRQQVNIMQQILEQGSAKEKSGASNVSQEILDVLRRIDERQESAGQSLPLTYCHINPNRAKTPFLGLIDSIQTSLESPCPSYRRRVRRRGHRSFARTWIIFSQRSTDGEGH